MGDYMANENIQINVLTDPSDYKEDRCCYLCNDSNHVRSLPNVKKVLYVSNDMNNLNYELFGADYEIFNQELVVLCKNKD